MAGKRTGLGKGLDSMIPPRAASAVKETGKYEVSETGEAT